MYNFDHFYCIHYNRALFYILLHIYFRQFSSLPSFYIRIGDIFMVKGMYLKTEMQQSLSNSSTTAYTGVGYKKSFGNTTIDSFGAVRANREGDFGAFAETRGIQKWSSDSPFSSEARLRYTHFNGDDVRLRLSPVKAGVTTGDFNFYLNPSVTLKHDFKKGNSIYGGAIAGAEYKAAKNLSIYGEMDYSTQSNFKPGKFVDQTAFNLGLRYTF